MALDYSSGGAKPRLRLGGRRSTPYTPSGMRLEALDWAVIAAYAVFALTVGVVLARRASRNVDEFFLSGRSLPWWIAGTSMVATTFAADTPLVITGWVRDHGIWKNWLWWCYAAGGLLTVFVFARYWRRGEVMTTAELAELRYGGKSARVLRGFLGVYHSAVTNGIVLCWVLLAATKIMDVLFGVDKLTALVLASGLALAYSLMAGFWGVVLTDLVQFVMAMVGSIALAVLAWDELGGRAGLEAAIQAGSVSQQALEFFPRAGASSWLDSSFWTAQVSAVAVYLGVAWWAAESVDGGGLVVQRISATRSEREGVLAALWYNVAHYGLRPWPWILVAVASIVVLPPHEVVAPASGEVAAVRATEIVLETPEPVTVTWDVEAQDWSPLPSVRVGQTVERGQLLARTDSERAYVVMMARLLPAGLLGLVVASLLAAFMSTIDTHVNLASSFFVNDVYRRFWAPGRPPRHYVGAARAGSVLVLALAGVLAWQADSISGLFTFFLAFLGGVGPIYILRWMWWRVRASTEIVAMVASSVTTIALTFAFDTGWPESPLTPEGVLSSEGRLCLVAFLSLTAALASMVLTRTPDPAALVEFYRRVRPVGAWGPVRRLCPDTARPAGLQVGLLGTVAGLALVFGILFATGNALLGRASAAGGCAVVALTGAVVVAGCLRADWRTRLSR